MFSKKLPLKLNFSPFVTILYNFGVSSEYDAEEGSLRLYVTNVNDALQILAAKEYLEDRLPAVFVKF